MSASIRVIATVKAERRFGDKGMSLLRLAGVSPGKLPRWFRRIVDHDFAGHFDADWFDHPARDGDSLVVEPYDLTDKSLRDLLAFSDQYALNLTISATSFHFPTRTVSVSLTPREETRAA